MIVLRPYQQTAIAAIRAAYAGKYRAPLLVSPTGSGKTVLFAHVAHGAQAKGKRVLIVAHRIELIEQISDALRETDTDHGFIAANYAPRRAQTQIASIATLIRRLDKVDAPDLIIVDEAHHSLASTWRAVLTRWPQAKILGVTATPVRTSGAGLGEIFDVMIRGPTVRELTPEYLSPARIFAPPTIDTSGLHTRGGDYITSESEAASDKPSVTGDALLHYKRHADGKSALVFCVSVAHAHHVAEQFRTAGYKALALDGGTDAGIRRQVVADFRRRSIQVLTSCDLFSEGFDCPGVEVGIMLRPTQSLGLHLQQLGRCLRRFEGKTCATIQDHAGNVLRLGPPSEDREWSLDGEVREKNKKALASVRVCPACWAANPPRACVCTECGTPFPKAPRQVDHHDGELTELTPEQLERRRTRRMQGRAQSLEQLQEFGRMKGYAANWANHVWAAREAKR